MTRTPPAPRLKRRYNLCHRLRLQGVPVDTDNHAINVATAEQFDTLPPTARRYLDELRNQYGFVVQTYIPGFDERTPPVKFHRKKSTLKWNKKT